MYKILTSALLFLALSACSEKPAVFTATKMVMSTNETGVVVKLALNKFTKGGEQGDGSIEIVKTPGSAWEGREGNFPITWKSSGKDGAYFITVPTVGDGFMLTPSPINTELLPLGGKKGFWCGDCERPRQKGLGTFPGSFIAND